jgi:glyoxylase-like metal-dependent hydrolase (beta-lactamase superfamily II)
MDFKREAYDPITSATWLVCRTCSTQFPTSDRQVVKTCHICDDPRQFVPPAGQTFTTLADLRRHHRNEFSVYEKDPRLTFVETTPRLAIGQRACVIRTPRGNVLWDCIALLDDDTVTRIKEMGGLEAIVISHPHYYSTHVQWARAFGCPVYIAAEDQEWTTLGSAHTQRITATETDVLPGSGIKVIKLGGHFPGSLVMLFDGRLLIADTVVTTPAGMGRWDVDGNGDARAKPPGLNTFSFLWSIPNMIPLAADELARMWDILKGYDFRATHGAFKGMDIEDEENIKRRVLDSMQIQTKFMGYEKHPLMSAKV